MRTSPRTAGAAGRIAEKQRKAGQAAAIAGLDPEYVTKLRHDCLKSANARMMGADPQAVVAEASKDFEARVRFLTERARS